ncbi:hypothetical protein, partial [Streptococcus pneumoniae]|uniref:hypothetical protein n=1 Tax=Streptococcus pneumoniae TaxID=1313 RepID=UPI001E4DCD60
SWCWVKKFWSGPRPSLRNDRLRPVGLHLRPVAVGIHRTIAGGRRRWSNDWKISPSDLRVQWLYVKGHDYGHEHGIAVLI